MLALLVLLPFRFPWLIVWIIFFLLFSYYIPWNKIPQKKRRNIAILTLLLPTVILLPFHFWGSYNLAGLDNGGFLVFGFGDWETSFSLPPETTYKSETLSNLYTLGGDDLYFSTTDEIIFYIVDENVPNVQYEWQNSSEITEYVFGTRFRFTLPYYYTDLFVISNWTFNIYNPSHNTTVDVTLYFFGHEDKNLFWLSHDYILNQEPTVGLVSFWMVGLIGIPVLYRQYRKDLSEVT